VIEGQAQAQALRKKFFPAKEHNPHDSEIDVTAYPPPLKFHYITPHEIQATPGVDGVPWEILKMATRKSNTILIHWLTKLFNAAMEQEHFLHSSSSR
jgi:hypothetical protein